MSEKSHFCSVCARKKAVRFPFHGPIHVSHFRASNSASGAWLRPPGVTQERGLATWKLWRVSELGSASFCARVEPGYQRSHDKIICNGKKIFTYFDKKMIVTLTWKDIYYFLLCLVSALSQISFSYGKIYDDIYLFSLENYQKWINVSMNSTWYLVAGRKAKSVIFEEVYKEYSDIDIPLLLLRALKSPLFFLFIKDMT